MLTNWRDWSLRTKLIAFAAALVTVPGSLFAFFAFSEASASLEREISIQLQQTAERGADAIAATVQRARSELRSWSRQDLMRDLLVGDIDKRVSQFLQTVRDSDPLYREVLAIDKTGTIIAASNGRWLGNSLKDWPSWSRTKRSLRGGGPSLIGPYPLEGLAPSAGLQVLELSQPIPNPDGPSPRIGGLILLFDWRGLTGIVDTIRQRFAEVDKRVAVLVLDSGRDVIGGVDFDGGFPAWALAWTQREGILQGINGTREFRSASGSLLLGAAEVPGIDESWYVVFAERSRDALAPVTNMRRGWTFVMLALLGVGLFVAIVLARQVLRPLDDLTRATAEITAKPDTLVSLPPVNSQNEIGQLTRSFNKMTSELEKSREEALSAAKFAFAGELAAMVAHEVRTPLTVMRSSAQMLADDSPIRPIDREELTETIVAEVDRVERVVTGLIQLARPIEPHREPVAVPEILRRATEFTAAHASQQGIVVTTDFDSRAPKVLGDPEQLYQVVLNLIVNALQALPRGGRLTLRSLPREGETTGFEIADDGPGLPEEIRDNVFKPFVTGREEGTGLGLAFVERVVNAHRGEVVVHSQPGVGTTFAIRLPILEDDE